MITKTFVLVFTLITYTGEVREFTTLEGTKQQCINASIQVHQLAAHYDASVFDMRCEEVGK